MLMGPYRNCYERVYVFSPSCAPGVDSTWDAWRNHVRTHMKVPDDEQTMWDTWEPTKLEALIERHKKVNAYLKAKKQKKWFNLLVLCDDFADSPAILHSANNILTSLFVRGRHTGCDCWILSQQARVISLIARTNFTCVLVWRMRNSKELAAIIEELDALVDRRTLMEMYKMATQEKHGFLYVNMLQEKENMFYKGFDQRFVLTM